MIIFYALGMAKRQKCARLAPPLPQERGLYRVDLPFGGFDLYESHNDALRAKMTADAAIAIEREVESATKQWVVSMTVAALKQRHLPTVKVKMAPISEQAVDAILEKATTQRCASR